MAISELVVISGPSGNNTAEPIDYWEWPSFLPSQPAPPACWKWPMCYLPNAAGREAAYETETGLKGAYSGDVTNSVCQVP